MNSLGNKRVQRLSHRPPRACCPASKLAGNRESRLTDVSLSSAATRRLRPRRRAAIASPVAVSGRKSRTTNRPIAREYDAVRRYGAFAFWSAPEGWESYVPSLWVGRNEGPVARTPPTPPTPPTG